LLHKYLSLLPIYLHANVTTRYITQVLPGEAGPPSYVCIQGKTVITQFNFNH